MNKVILVGRITRDPELKSVNNGLSVVNFTLAVNRPFQDQQGERNADFINCSVWRKQAENLAKYVKKGSLIGVEGRVQTRSYEVDGSTRYVTEVLCENIQFLDTKGDSASKEAPAAPVDDDPFAGKIKNVADDDLPF